MKQLLTVGVSCRTYGRWYHLCMYDQSFSARRVHCCYHQGWALQWNEVFLGKRGLLNTYISPWLRSSLALVALVPICSGVRALLAFCSAFRCGVLF